MYRKVACFRIYGTTSQCRQIFLKKNESNDSIIEVADTLSVSEYTDSKKSKHKVLTAMPINDAFNNDVSLTGLSPDECFWAIRSLEDSSFGRCVPRTMRP